MEIQFSPCGLKPDSRKLLPATEPLQGNVACGHTNTQSIKPVKAREVAEDIFSLPEPISRTQIPEKKCFIP
jgi:hypothetical protein